MAEICALCAAPDAAVDYTVEAAPSPTTLTLCEPCAKAVAAPAQHSAHWQDLPTLMWTDDTAVQVTAYRILRAMPEAAFATDALDMLYLDPDVQAWADAALFPVGPSVPTLDANGGALLNGDDVTLIKDLPVKGAGFTAKRGTKVRSITLTDNPEHIEGRVNGQRIVIISGFVKKS